MAGLLLVSIGTHSAVLPEDRADIMYHGYDGDGVRIDGPSFLVRKNIADKVSVYGNYYTDQVSGASIDVLSYGSAYTEERNEYSIGADYLYDKTIMSLSYLNSDESDYVSDAVSFDVSHDFFGDLSTLSMGFSYAEDTVGRNGDDSFSEEAEHKRYRIGLTQVITKNILMNVSFETAADQGYLNNPYRQVRFLTGDGTTASSKTELYPNTRNSDAIAVKGMFYLPYRAAIRADYRFYSDSWGIEASNYELRYIHPLKEVAGLTLEAKYRFYDQTQADFYSDLLPFEDATNFYGRDKELSTYTTNMFGIGASYELKHPWLSFFDKTTINAYWDYIQFDYENFRDMTQSNDGSFAIGEEPFFNFDANVLRFYISFWY
ncbi:DUF3570 domain-containing protein [Marinibactrum halimedae]|uniref:DUF3570 domain-containing protein n=1 Tax=Marinibactrum halimedae TaxID=1444977 RepID=A0AA37T905_9GAMM|nr:DUF3570 domain-containing protein [Marinibactrum halimedae]MCD9457774.1 DUF3570 domain-containing protein [Marinibactrum halimedae]GLS24852.1 hypothetical protein GCM10007877_05660 [Marinibactrum halimedae]